MFAYRSGPRYNLVMAKGNNTGANMDRWIIYHEDGTEERFDGDREAVVAHLVAKYQGKSVEAFTDQVLVYNPEDLTGDEIGCDPLASAVSE